MLAPVATVRRWRARQTRAGWAAAWRRARQLRPEELRRRWAELQTLRFELFEAGGKTIDLPGAGPGEERVLAARTVVQPDGDTLWIVDEDALEDAGLMEAHLDEVARWYGEATDTVNALALYLRTVRATVTGVTGILSGGTSLLSSSWVVLAGGLLLSVGVQPLLRVIIGRRMRRGMAVVL